MRRSRRSPRVGDVRMQEATSRRVVPVLDRDAELGTGIPPEQLLQARQASVASVRSITAGPWDALDGAAARGGFGMLVLDGLLVRDVGVDGRYGAEVLGPADLLRPENHDGSDALLPVTASWRVIADARVAGLDPRWAPRMAPWPSVACELAGRGVMRARRLVVMLAIAQQPRLDLRLWML